MSRQLYFYGFFFFTKHEFLGSNYEN